MGIKWVLHSDHAGITLEFYVSATRLEGQSKVLRIINKNLDPPSTLGFRVQGLPYTPI